MLVATLSTEQGFVNARCPAKEQGPACADLRSGVGQPSAARPEELSPLLELRPQWQPQATSQVGRSAVSPPQRVLPDGAKHIAPESDLPQA